jgi:hypothetical protein
MARLAAANTAMLASTEGQVTVGGGFLVRMVGGHFGPGLDIRDPNLEEANPVGRQTGPLRHVVTGRC